MKNLPALNFDDSTSSLPDLDFSQDLPELFPDKPKYSYVQGTEPSFIEKIKNKVSDMFAPPDPGLGPLTKEDFAAFKPADVARTPLQTETSDKEGIYEGFIKPTLKAIPRVYAAITGTLALLPEAGIEALGKFLPDEDIDAYREKYKTPRGMLDAINKGEFKPIYKKGGTLADAEKALEERLRPYAELIKTPEEAQAMENIGLASKPFEMAGEGWGMIGQAINDALKDPNMPPDEDPIAILEPFLATMGEASAVFGVSGVKGVFEKVKNSNTYRQLTIPERRLVVQDLAETMQKNPQMTEGEILRKYDNPTWKAEALKNRAVTTEPDLPPLFEEKPVTSPAGFPVNVSDVSKTSVPVAPKIKFVEYQDILKTGDYQPIFEVETTPDTGKWAIGSTLTMRGLKEQGLTPPEFPPSPESKKEPYS
jgi:hypothetical protein